MRFIHYLLVLFIVVPIGELLVLFRIGGAIGILNTFMVIIITGIIGAYLARQQGVKTLEKIRSTLSQGRIPGNEFIDGLIILIAGAVLLTPGFLTDITGFLLLLPAGRVLFRAWLIKRFKNFIVSGKARRRDGQGAFSFPTAFDSKNQSGDESFIDVEGKDLRE